MVIKSYVYDIIYLAAVIVIFIIMVVVIRKKCKKWDEKEALVYLEIDIQVLLL